jgi:nucleoside 2-deoxyribosyltransferase
MQKVYLSGPITGLSFQEAVSWTDVAKTTLWERYGIKGFRPLRGKNEALKNIRSLSAKGHPESVVSSAKGIFGRDMYDVRSADAILVNVLGAKIASQGTVSEITAAWCWGKPIVLVIEDDGNVMDHVFVTEPVTYRVNNLEDAYLLINLLLNDD